MVDKKLVLSATLWTVFGHTSTKLVRLISNLILTRLLFPDVFGVVAIVYVVISLVAMMTDMGVGPYIIQNKEENSEKLLNTAWTIQIIRSLIVWFFISFLSLSLYYIQYHNSEILGSVYQNSELPILIFVASFSVIISGFNSISIHTIDRSLKIKRLELIRFFSKLLSIIIMIVLALYSPDVWSVIVGSLCYSLLVMISSHLFLPGIFHKIYWDHEIAKKILSFGKWIMLSTMMTMAIMHGDKLILSGFISTGELGLYTISLLFIEAVRGVFSSLSGKIWFPLLSKVKREGSSKINSVYYKIRFYQDMASYLCAGMLFVLAPLLIEFLYDARYTEAGYILSIISFSIAGISLETISFVFLSVGSSKVASFINLARAISLWGCLYVAIKYYDLTTALWAVSLNYLLVLPLAWVFLRRYKILVWYKELWTLPFLPLGYGIGIGIESLINYFGGFL